MAKTFGCVRFVYNYYLDACKKSKKADDLETLKSQHMWLKDVDPKALEFALKKQEQCYKSFLSGKIGELKFKKKKDHRLSYTTKGEIKYLLDKYIELPELGRVKMKADTKVKTKTKFEPQGKIWNATISQASSGKYYVSLCCEEEDADKLPAVNRNVGIKLGLDNYLVLDNGIRIPNPKHLDRSMKKIKRLSRELNRKTKDGSNWEKTRIKLARAHEHVANQRRNFLQQLSTGLVKAYDHIYIEDLPVQDMMRDSKRKRGSARDMWGAAWAEFIRELWYKSDWYGRKLTKVKKLDPDIQICNCCGGSYAIKDDMWLCPGCGALLDRDINAAINIRNSGLAKAQPGVCTVN